MSPTLQTVQIVLQALSSFAIAGGLIFTAIQFRNERKAQIVANFSKLIELQSQLRYLRVEQPSLASVSPGDVGTTGADSGYVEVVEGRTARRLSRLQPEREGSHDLLGLFYPAAC